LGDDEKDWEQIKQGIATHERGTADHSYRSIELFVDLISLLSLFERPLLITKVKLRNLSDLFIRKLRTAREFVHTGPEHTALGSDCRRNHPE